MNDPLKKSEITTKRAINPHAIVTQFLNNQSAANTFLLKRRKQQQKLRLSVAQANLKSGFDFFYLCFS